MKLHTLLLALALTTAAPMVSHARDGFGNDGRPLVCDPVQIPDSARLKKCQEWIVNAKQPDIREVSCCGDGDAFITDDYTFDKKTGKFYAIVTQDYPARAGYEEPSIPKGFKIEIPPNKVNNARLDGGNPSGHSVTFLSSSLFVYCYFGPTGT